MKDPNLEALDFKIIQLEKEYCIYKAEIIKEQSLISRHLQSLYPNTEAIHERNMLINELEKAMKDAERNIGKYKREREKICRKRINILKKAIERLENEYQDHLMRQEQERESLEKATGDEHLFKHRKAVLQETESVIIAVQNELTKYKEELKNLKIVKDMDDECFA